MAKIVISENVSLDGVVEDPTGEGGFRHGGWFQQAVGQDSEVWAKALCEEALRTEALLMGRATYEYFSERWQERTGVWANKLNGMPKYVVSSTLNDSDWNNSRVLGGDPVDAVRQLKQQVDGDIVVYASRQLAHTLMEHALVDELRLIVFPVVLGAGDRLFGDTTDKTALRLVNAQTLGEGLASMNYATVR